MNHHLLPCPFCGGSNIDPAEWFNNDGKSGPGCVDCGAIAESAVDWNRRGPAPTSEPGVRDAVCAIKAMCNAGALPPGARSELLRALATPASPSAHSDEGGAA